MFSNNLSLKYLFIGLIVLGVFIHMSQQQFSYTANWG